MIKKINKTKFIIEINKLETISTDILCLWSTNELNRGDKVWKRVQKAAGSKLYEESLEALMQYGTTDETGKIILPTSRCIFTTGGFLNIYYIIHSVLPYKKNIEEKENKEMYLARTMQNIQILSETISEEKIKIYKLAFYPIPEIVYGNVTNKDITDFFKALLNFKKFKEIKIVCETEEEYNLYSSLFLKLTTPLVERIINKIFKNKF